MEEKIIEFLTGKLDLTAIYIFGSSLTPYFRNDSDIDIAFISPQNLSAKEIFDLQLKLSVILDRDVDLIDFTNISTVFQVSILKNNKVIYCADDEARLDREMRALSDYVKLNDERDMILRTKYGYSNKQD